MPEASYPCGNYSDISCLKHKKSERSWGSHFTFCILLKIKINLSFVLLCGRFLSSWAHFRTPALLSNRCTASVKLPPGIDTGVGCSKHMVPEARALPNLTCPHTISYEYKKAKNSGILASRNGRSCHVPTWGLEHQGTPTYYTTLRSLHLD